MHNLSKLLPSETLLILDGKKSTLKELLKLTLMDLLLKQVIETTVIGKRAGNGNTYYYKYVIRGKNFINYRPLAHEIVFLLSFQKSSSIKLLFQHLIRIGFQNAKSESIFHSAVINSPRIERYFTKNFIQSIFGGFSINDEGLSLRDKIKAEIENLEKELPEIINNDKTKALNILNTIGGNIFLLKNIDFALLKQIDSEILAEMNRKDKESSSGGDSSGCYGCSTWDSACSSWTSSGCSGTTGCSDSTSSGCSGCSGCGGD